MPEVDVERHVAFLLKMATDRGFEWTMSEYLRMSGIYWSLTALHIIGAHDRLPKDELVAFVKSCQMPSGGFCPAPGHHESIVYTLSAIQVLIIYNELDHIDVDQLVVFVESLQNENGSFRGYPDEAGSESDTRYGFCAVAALRLIGRLEKSKIDVASAAEHVLACQNFDGGFGVRIGSESHAAQVFCAVGTLKVLGQLHRIDTDALGWWLADRQLECGGLNGRPMKLQDVCYSWWVLSSLNTIERSEWIDAEKLKHFILQAQDTETGGIADRPGDYPDPFHTLFGLAALSLMQQKGEIELDVELGQIDPLFCMPKSVMDRLSSYSSSS